MGSLRLRSSRAALPQGQQARVVVAEFLQQGGQLGHRGVAAADPRRGGGRRLEHDLLDPDPTRAGVERGAADLLRPVRRPRRQRRMRRRRPVELDPQRQQTAVHPGHLLSQPALEPAERLINIDGAGGIHPAGTPADHVQPTRLDGDDLQAVADRHQGAPLGPRLADVTPLDVPREDDPGVLGVQLLAGVDMPQRQ